MKMMKRIVVLLIIFEILIFSINGQQGQISDPAPGRSPGPPKQETLINSNSSSLSSSSYISSSSPNDQTESNILTTNLNNSYKLFSTKINRNNNLELDLTLNSNNNSSNTILAARANKQNNEAISNDDRIIIYDSDHYILNSTQNHHHHEQNNTKAINYVKKLYHTTSRNNEKNKSTQKENILLEHHHLHHHYLRSGNNFQRITRTLKQQQSIPVIETTNVTTMAATVSTTTNPIINKTSSVASFSSQLKDIIYQYYNDDYGNDDASFSESLLSPAVDAAAAAVNIKTASCKNQLSNYLKTDEKIISVQSSNFNEEKSEFIIKGNQPNESTTTFSSLHPDVHLHIGHDTFSLQSGIVCGLMYKFMLKFPEKVNVKNFFMETLVAGKEKGNFIREYSDINKLPTPLSSSSSSSMPSLLTPVSSYQSSSSWYKIPSAFVFPSSNDDVGDVNWASGNPSNNEEHVFHRNKQNNGEIISSDNTKITEVDGNGDENDKILDKISSNDKWFDEDNNFFNENNNDEYENSDDEISSNNSNEDNNDSHNDSTESSKANRECNVNNKWNYNYVNNRNKEPTIFWIMNENCDNEDSLEIRLFFRTEASSTNNEKDERIVYKKSFFIKINKECRLVLRKFSGNFDYTSLPLYATDCLILFPSQLNEVSSTEKSSSTSTSSTIPSSSSSNTLLLTSKKFISSVLSSTSKPPGILVELIRLNIPCHNGGYIKFSDKLPICGKLEELQVNERTYHFDINKNFSIKIFNSNNRKNNNNSSNNNNSNINSTVTSNANNNNNNLNKEPMMFSLKYQIVDYCYNMTLFNKNDTFFIKPFRNVLKCYFKIHLPYGNQIELNLITNFLKASELLNKLISSQNDFNYNSNNNNNKKNKNRNKFNTNLSDSMLNEAIFFSNNINLASKYATHINLSKTTTYMNNINNNNNDNVNNNHNNYYFSNDDKITLENNKNIGHSSSNYRDNHNINNDCLNNGGMLVRIAETKLYKWSYCIRNTNESKWFKLTSKGNILVIQVIKSLELQQHHHPHHHNQHQYVPEKQNNNEGSKPQPQHSSTTSTIPSKTNNEQETDDDIQTLYFTYKAKPITDIVSKCAFGWIAVGQLCVSAIQKSMTWHEGEQYCTNRGGHLASIRSEFEQKLIDKLLINSPSYQDSFAYWVGGSDLSYEGDFRWSDGLPFLFTHWFPGWPQHAHYNKQPNDDGLSGQDCIELRRYFRSPPGIQFNEQTLSSTFMWNDRDCNAKNFIICERSMMNEASSNNWFNDCNKTITLSIDNPKSTLWSPSFPRQYPDNANCFTTILAPSNYRIVLEFEELVIENEPGCSYDYIEITEPHSAFKRTSDANLFRTSRHGKRNENHGTNTNSYDNLSHASISNNNNNNNFESHLTSTSFHSSSSNDNQNLLNIFTNLFKPWNNVLIQTPTYPRGKTLYKTTRPYELPKRLCGDWSSKLKLLRYTSSGSYLGIHFVSDYSHHYGGYKAKVYMENAISECSDDRLKPYNGSCYLFVHYPTVDWVTAQHVCRGIGAELSSDLNPDEHRFITTSIRNETDYSPQRIYWLGAELDDNQHYKWSDEATMSFQGWLPGQGTFNKKHDEMICLGLQWKMSPTPMLPSGLYWESQKCNTTGGYVCKKPKQILDQLKLKNETISGTEGRLTSPGYPNQYPLNINYWVKIISPERTRIIVQFQKIDLESQDECLYDYIIVQNYETLSEISLEPGTNPIPMAMLTEDKMNFEKLQYQNERMVYARRLRRSTIDDNRQHKPSSLPSKHYFEGKLKRIFKRMPSSLAHNYLSSSSSSSSSNSLKSPIKPQKYAKVFFNSSSSPSNIDSKSMMISYSNGTTTIYESSSLRDRFSAILMNRKRRRRKRKYDFYGNNDYDDRDNDNTKQYRKQQKRLKRHTSLSSEESIDAVTATNYGNENIIDVNNAQSFLPYVRWCGSHDSNMSKFDFISSSNEVILNFHSDYSIAGGGFAATWKAIDISGCPLQILTSREGIISSPNYPHFLINNLDCTYVIQAPTGNKVWIEFKDFDISDDTIIYLDIGFGLFKPFHNVKHINEGVFISTKEQIRIQIKTGQKPRGRGFQANFKTVWSLMNERIIHLSNDTTGYLYHLNYPHKIPANVEFIQHLIVPLGDNILLELYGVEFSENGCPDHNILEVYDNYADKNGTKWTLCKHQNSDLSQSPVQVTSFLNTIHIRQKTLSESRINLNATIRIQKDLIYKSKLENDDSVESCAPNPCLHDGKCTITSEQIKKCQCPGHYTGRFCGLNMCELQPCLFGKCELTPLNFKCHCQSGYTGRLCEQKRKPCAENPCEGRGECFEKNGGFFCRCHAWWEGTRCERRMIHIPYKPLSERMLQEPFWLGLITVFVVLAIIGLIWCAKRHFPEKIEKLLAEEAERNRPPGVGHHHHTSLREQLQFTSAVPQSTVVTPGAPRSIFNRLGIRKPSILSLSSPNPSGGATARTFSLDDLLRPPPRRSPSPRKKRNNSTPTKKSAAEKKQILQQLVSPAAHPTRQKISLGEFIQLSENRLKPGTATSSENDLKETNFSETLIIPAVVSPAGATASRSLTDPKLEKKVTFARLLSKVSAEMNSGSTESGMYTRNSSALSLPTEIQYLPTSLPPSPITSDLRSPHSTSSNHGSDSLSSSEIALSDICLRITQAAKMASNRRSIRPKVSSADSILAMFRTQTTASSTPLQTSSLLVSPSTTPTASSPQDDMVGDDESSTSSMHTPISYASGAPDSPVFYRQTTIEVPVLDALNAHKSMSPSSSSASVSSSTMSNTNLLHPPTILLEIPSNGINKCLSPIRELPTPIPSPALTPIMSRPNRSNSPLLQNDPLSGSYSDDDDDDRSDQFLSDSIFGEYTRDSDRVESEAETPTETADSSNKTTLTVAKFNLMPPPSIVIDIEPPTPEERAPRPTNLVIPVLTVEQPSPTKDKFSPAQKDEPSTGTENTTKPVLNRLPTGPGSPPPQRASVGETCFVFPNKQQQKRLLKQYEKPTSLDLTFTPPMITVTSNIQSELESDFEPMSPAPNKIISGTTTLLCAPNNQAGMSYLSPFAICTRADRTISESNLSSSGYSSMASPGPSRCGSSNPLYSNEMDEPGGGPSGLSHFSLGHSLLSRRQSATLPICKENILNEKSSTSRAQETSNAQQNRLRRKSDSETLSDDPLIESNDEGIGTDHLDDKTDDADLKRSTIVEVSITEDSPETVKSVSNAEETVANMSQLQLPSIVIQSSEDNSRLSPVSSRSESPLSEKAGMGRFSPQFYGRKDHQLPFTDSDGLYDFPSSDSKSTIILTNQRRSSSKKRDRRTLKTTTLTTAQVQSPVKNNNSQLDLPTTKETNTNVSNQTSTSLPKFYQQHHHHYLHGAHHSHYTSSVTARKSPKRRLIQRHPITSSSSSSESLTSTKEYTIKSSPARDIYLESFDNDDDHCEDASTQILPTAHCSSLNKPRISRLRAISNQIRFLRRLEKSIKRREQEISPSDSCVEDCTDDTDSPSHVTSPLLKHNNSKSPTIISSSSSPPSQTAIATKNRVPSIYRQKRLPLTISADQE